MSASFAVSAAVRPRRTAAARRALLVLLFLGGFLTLAFLFGGHAHAAENASAGKSAGNAVGKAAAGTGPQALGGSRGGSAAGGELPASVRGTVAGVPQAADRNVRRTGAAVDAAVKPVAGAVDQVTGPVAAVVGPVADLPGKLTAGLGAGSAYDSGRAATPALGGIGTVKAGLPAAATDVRASSATGSARPAHPAPALQPAGGGGAEHRAPLGDPCSPSVPASQFTSGDSSPRGADQHATLPSDRMGCVPTAGAVSSATVAPIYQRPGDVLEFPA